VDYLGNGTNVKTALEMPPGAGFPDHGTVRHHQPERRLGSY
jgi:hypothetical protein